MKNFLLFIFVLSSIVCVLSFAGSIYYFQGKIVYERQFSLNDFKTDSTVVSLDSVKIPENLSACEVLVYINPELTTKYEGYAEVDIFDDEDTLSGNIEGDIYYDFGYDSDGSWTERKTEVSKIFRLKDGGGKFRFDISFAKTKGFEVYNPASNTPAYLRIYTPDSLLSTYLIYSGAIFFSISALLLCFKDAFFEKK
ncbi:MAG: hypothetical protein EAZ85_15010 [Bacteroidetes bacterium]|nr:MAG: hypothetical protein EAZ85_15010 [Bacteroidota bacterium]TAG88383.1 MAG: hypothetical protein EAZ20_08650 [Bacteroidota bacterium]